MKTTISLTRTTPTPEPRQLLWGDVTEPGLYRTTDEDSHLIFCYSHQHGRKGYNPETAHEFTTSSGLWVDTTVTRLPDDYKLVIEISNGGGE